MLASAALLMEMSPLANPKASNVNSQTFKTVNDSTEARYVSVDGVKINKNPDLAINPKAQNGIGATKIVKTAIKLIINNKSKVEQRLVNSKAEVLIEAEQTSNRVSKEVFNESSNILERYTSEFINNVSTGMSFNYDDNGNIQSANIGPEGIKIDTSKFVINDGDVIVQNGRTTIKDAYIDKLFSKQATIEYLKATDIDLNRATIIGSRAGESTVITGGKIRSTGSFVRTFPQGNVTYEAFTESWNRVYRA
ncbi:hypothetical protein [Staphylococcus pseudintermedius]|uniref:hypothetical protein n=2 Tax=Staphylococcus pseudintermedius TaxID=283734 RepID=UPI003F9719C4